MIIVFSGCFIVNDKRTSYQIQQNVIIFGNMDAKIAISSQLKGLGFEVKQFKTAELAIYSYFLESEGESFLIDPTLDTKTYQSAINQHNSTLKYVFLTHYHADFLSGHTQLKAEVVMGPEAKRQANQFKLHEAKDGEIFNIGSVKIKVIHTPGHTLESSCYLLSDKEGKEIALFTGDTVFLGEVGRPDLAASENSLTKEDLAGLLFDSIQKLKHYADDIRVYPGHGAGSACGKSIGGGDFCTLEQQKKNNYGFVFQSKEEFVKEVSNIGKPPKYFFHDAALNQQGPRDYSELVKTVSIPLTPTQFQELNNLPIVDFRNGNVEGIIKGSYWLPSKGAITTWISNIFPPQTEFLVVTEKGKFEQIADRLLRIGYFNIKGYNGFELTEWQGELSKPTIIGFEKYKELKELVHLDVRNLPEFLAGGLVEGSLPIPLPEMTSRWEELKGKEGIVISCRTGMRARVAYSILKREGIDSTILSEGFDCFATQGLKIVPFEK